MDSSIQTGGKDFFRRFDPNFSAPLSRGAPCFKFRRPGAAPHSRGCAWLFSLQLEGLARDPASRHGAGVNVHAPLVPAPPGWDYDHDSDDDRDHGTSTQVPEPRSQVRRSGTSPEPRTASPDYEHDYELRTEIRLFTDSPIHPFTDSPKQKQGPRRDPATDETRTSDQRISCSQPAKTRTGARSAC